MKIICETTLDLFRAPGLCEVCRQGCTAREAHHLRAKGSGGAGRLDLRINLIATGSTLAWQCQCHTEIHDGKIPRNQLLEMVAAREKARPEDITAVLDLLRRLMKPSASELAEAVHALTTDARLLAIRELQEAGVWL